VFSLQAVDFSSKIDSTGVKSLPVINTDSLLNVMSLHVEHQKIVSSTQSNSDSIVVGNKIAATKEQIDNGLVGNKDSLENHSMFIIPSQLIPVHVDSLLLAGNPFFIDLVFMGYPYPFHWKNKPDFCSLYFGEKATTLTSGWFKSFEVPKTDQVIADLRDSAREAITRNAIYLYTLSYDELPDPSTFRNHVLKVKRLKHVEFVNEYDPFDDDRNKDIYYKKEQLGPWSHSASALAQFSENTVTRNWYQGGNNNVAILGILSGKLNYDDKKYIQWENNAEWHLGFNSVDGDTLRWLSTNDDVFRINSKLGVKAGGNLFYSGSVDFSTQFFNSYNGVNSTFLKTSFLTPISFNVGVGLDYKYKKFLSVMVSPFAYKYIYMNDIVHVNPNLFGIQSGQNTLSEVGSSFTAQLSYPISHEIQLDSKLSFYTNYQKVEADLEVVCNLIINRFMSTRISIHPRYDNTVIMPDGKQAALQFKQLVSVGFSHRF
jgi:hypothetical protein